MDRIGLYTLDRVLCAHSSPSHPSSKVRGEFMFLSQSFLRLCNNVEWRAERKEVGTD